MDLILRYPGFPDKSDNCNRIRTETKVLTYPLLTAAVGIFFSFNVCAQVFHVATSGNDDTGNGSELNPWATISHAIDNVSDGDTIEVGAGVYNGRVRLDQQFNSAVIVRSSTPYSARLRHNQGAVIICYTCQGVVVEGFDIAHSAGNTGALVIQIQDLLGSSNGSNGGTDPVVSNVTLRNNIIHDSTNNDLLKINNGAEDILVEGNIFYNQAGSDEHIDINSTAQITVQDNVFFNSGTQSTTSSFVVVKDSNGASDTVLGAQDTTIRRNIFLNWQGSDGQGFVRIGEDSTTNFEADGVLIENNLLLGNSGTLMRSALTVQGSRDVRFRYNTVSGNLPSRSYAARLIALGDNQPNEQVSLEYNIWSDSSGTMGTEGFIGADVFEANASSNSNSVTLNRNLYYNGGAAVPSDSSQEINIAVDGNAIVGNPELPEVSGITPPVWTGTQFAGGFASIQTVFTHFAQTYGIPAQSGAGVNQGSRFNSPAVDLLGNARGSAPDIGALEITASNPPVDPPAADTSEICFPLPADGNANSFGVICL